MITVNGHTLEWRDGMTVADVLSEMKYSFPLITVTINGIFVPRDLYESTTVPDGAEVKVIHIHHGG